MSIHSNNSTPTSSTSSMKTASSQSNQQQAKTKRSLSTNTTSTMGSSSATSSTSSSCSIQTEKRKSLVPSPTIYMVSLAEAEIDDDDEEDELFDDGQKVKKKSNVLSSVSNLNENTTINSKQLHDHLSDDVEYVDEDTNSDKSAKFDESIEETNNLDAKPTISSEYALHNNQETSDVLRHFLDEKEDNTNSTLSGIDNSLVFKNMNGLNSISNNSASLLSSSSSSATSSSTTAPVAKLLTPDERISNEVREYWATIDLYNNSKMAFNKRCKSVKLKREKLNAEIKKRYSDQSHTKPTESISTTTEAINFENNTNNSSLCTCVKCSIAYHEAKIKGITDVNEIICSKCSNKLLICKCCSFHSSSNSLDTNSSATTPSSITTSSSTSNSIITNNQNSNSKSSTQTPVCTTQTTATVCSTSQMPSSEFQAKNNLNEKKPTNSNNEFVQFEEKLFNIKNELVSLSETSLDVFQLLLQLSDTMLDLNNQLNTSVNANQYFLTSNGHKFNINNLLMMSSANIYEEDEGESSQQQLQQNVDHILANKTTPLTCNTFMNNTNDSQVNRPFSPNPNKPNTPNTITNIINSINSKIQSSHTGPLSPGSMSNKVKRNSSVFNKTPSSTTHENKFFDNIYDRSSVSQFVDSLFSSNNKSSHFLSEDPSLQSFLTTESNYYSSLADEDVDNHGVLLEQDELMMIVNSSKPHRINQNSSSISNNSNQHLTNSISHSSDISFMNNTSPNSHLPPHSTSKSHLNTNGSLSSLNHHQQSASVQSAQVKKRISTTTSTTNQILARQTSNTLNTNKQFNSLNQPSRNGKQATLVKSSTSSTSSSGCGGSSSLSSNIDLSSLPSTCSSFINMNDEQQLLSKQAENVNRRSLSSVKSSSSGCSSGESNINTNVTNIDNSLKQLNRHSTVSNCSSKSINNSIASCSAEQRIIDQIEDYENVQANQSPKSPTGSVAGLAAAYLSNRSNSVNYKNSNHVSNTANNTAAATPTCHLTHSASIAYRKPSFKFESNIFNRVQNMNISKIKCLDSNGKQISKPLDENEITTGQSDFKSIINSNKIIPINGDNLKRHKLIINKFNENSQQQNAMKSNHQISLDSGIYLPSESEDNNSFNLNIVK